MKKLLLAILVVASTTTIALAQQGQGIMRIHAAKMAYITDRLQLTQEQSYRFTPLFNDYEKEIRQTRQYYFKKYKGGNLENASDAEALRYIDDNLDYQQQVIQIKREYNSRFLKIISPQQLSMLYKAEREFRQMLLKHLRQRRNGEVRNNRMSGY